MISKRIWLFRTNLKLIFLFTEFPIFPDHFSILSTSPPFYNCIKIDQPRDLQWETKFLCYKPALKTLTIIWSNDGPITGQECINTAMPYERGARFWTNSFLCLPRQSVLRLTWSISRPLNGQKCLVIREGKLTRRRYFLCGKMKYEKIGKTRYLICSESLIGLFAYENRFKLAPFVPLESAPTH